MINLEKGQRISMDKGLSLVGVGLGWDSPSIPSLPSNELNLIRFQLVDL
jgi:stress response protein SCP2